MKLKNLTRTAKRVSNVVKPDNIAVGGVKKRDAEAIKVQAAYREASRISLRLRENVLRAKC